MILTNKTKTALKFSSELGSVELPVNQPVTIDDKQKMILQSEWQRVSGMIQSGAILASN